MKSVIINNPKALPKIVKFLKKYFENVRQVRNKYSHLASRSQNYFTIILFENRGQLFSIRWNHGWCVLYLGDITKAKTPLQYTFTKMAFDTCYPIEEGSNANVVFWSLEITDEHDDMPRQISPLRLPVTRPSLAE